MVRAGVVGRHDDRGLRARARPYRTPRTPAQFRQLQFHCGNPPPTEEPSTRILIVERPQRCLRLRPRKRSHLEGRHPPGKKAEALGPAKG